MTNIFKKYTQGVYVMLSDQHGLKNGDQATIETKYGKEIEVTVWKILGKHKDGGSLYSVTRNDGFNRKEWLKSKAERQRNASERQACISEEMHTKSQKDKDFLSLGEPIKVGHHSEGRHRKIIDQAWNNMGKSVKAYDKSNEHSQKALTIEARINKEISLDTPESLHLLEQRIQDLENKRDTIKQREHASFELSNIGAKIRRYKQRLSTSRELWDQDYIKAPKKAVKKDDINTLLERHGGFFAFNNGQLNDGLQGRHRGDFYHFGHGLILPKENLEAFKKDYKRI